MYLFNLRLFNNIFNNNLLYTFWTENKYSLNSYFVFYLMHISNNNKFQYVNYLYLI